MCAKFISLAAPFLALFISLYFGSQFLLDIKAIYQNGLSTVQDILLDAKTTPWTVAVSNQSLYFEDIGHFNFMFAHPWLEEGHEYKIWYLPNSRQVLRAELIR